MLYILSEGKEHLPVGREPMVFIDEENDDQDEEHKQNEDFVVVESQHDHPRAMVQNFDITKHTITTKLKGMGHVDYMDYYIQQELYINIDL